MIACHVRTRHFEIALQAPRLYASSLSSDWSRCSCRTRMKGFRRKTSRLAWMNRIDRRARNASIGNQANWKNLRAYPTTRVQM